MPGKRSGDNEDPQKVKRPRGRPPGPKARLSAAARAAVVEAAAAWAAAEATPGGAEAMGILLPGQTRIKRRRRVMPLEDKMKILEKLEEGVSNTDVGRLFGVNESTVRTIKKNEKAIRASMESVSPVSSKVLCVPRDVNIEKMETELTFWVEDQTIGGRPLTLKAICSQAKRIYKQLVETTGNGNPDKFHASKGWFEKFRNRYSLRNSRLMGEEEPLNAQSAPKYSKQLQRLIRARGYVPQQVFNAEEMSLFWKCMPSRTFREKDKNPESLEEAKDRISLIFCANAAGDKMIKPLLLYKDPNPTCLLEKDKNRLPVFWRSHPKVSLTAALFLDWFHNCFIHQARSYLIEKNLEFRVLLILDRGPNHPDSLFFAHPNVDIVFLPLEGTSYLQPLDQGIIEAFRRYYTKHMFDHFADCIEKNPCLTLKETWQQYNIADALVVIKEAMDDIKPAALNKAWWKLWDDVVNDYACFPRANEEVAKIVESAKRMDFKFLDIEEGEINELLKFQALAITERESVSINAEEDKSPEPEVKMNLRKLNAVLRQASDLIDAAIDMDPFLDRSLAFKKDFNKLLYTYKEVQKNLQNKAKELKKEKDTNKEEVVWMKKMDTESESEGESESESESKSESESHKEEQVERRKEDKKPPEEDPGPSSSSTETLTISEESAKAINAELDFWNLTLELNLERVDVPELKEENPEAVPSK
ncbi:tigger transposable element-derived protein 1-like [Mirounga leonina]|uniref:tigger transposable element-derived protein 1-like n=1 Tax=Mirounga leonina TaxID=9715 RepID=UPI00156C50CD|nr:tigger transposable element-derived protein 1-like [Mirounga leonina]XP_034871827.1 tigger transposable element-derived protein 1-like [Mirounga leonina]XP_034871828.1 tigger transposable element-derived protein 1-like [Mirounga leonina]XP_034871829.1 tigger transposable element-derived protein 1-like [Mirounga leonina]XP_034871830.1 tigger transposable element-derived protein 1-like [Mirounga leonina]XP_034871831.1 tigger transposable element-derived protein 1-like [Mirounga leonina]